MSCYWIVECFPISITSLLPVFLFPIFGIMKAKEVSKIYFHDNVMFIFSSLIIGLGIETTGLHEKLALRICMSVGSEPKWILLGIMSATGFLSVWISNTATASMILPIVVSLVKQLVILDPDFQEQVEINGQKVSSIEMNSFESSATLKDLKDEDIRIELKEEISKIQDDDEDVFRTKNAKNLIKAFCLSITYAATIGGTGSLIGTSSNIVFKGFFETRHPEDAMNFFTFMLYSIPISFILIVVCWVVLCLVWFPKGKFIGVSSREGGSTSISKIIRDKYENLGPYTWEQKSIGFWFILVVTLWITRDLYFVPGWGVLFKKDYITDTSSAILVLILICAWPKDNPFTSDTYEPLMTWKKIEKLFPWSLIFLIGGSLAMAEGCEKSGLSLWFGDFLEKVLPKQKVLLFIVITVFSVFGTEFISNISMASIMLPILDSLAETYGYSYYYVLLPQAIAVNFSYMFPAAAPSNAVVFAGGYLTLTDMIKTGIILKLFAFIVLFLASHTWLELIFKIPDIPTINNSTTLITTTEFITEIIANSTYV
ncbi:unnamed protein product [Brachionus calyciflorus]|uniref:Uncharacterized protein n=1 Tax=Brachionus calyciflorus TaxID=104777 RepID=A0A813U9T2_9BILA|nr:unnamed protein product [Brachionus calyciflorus]